MVEVTLPQTLSLFEYARVTGASVSSLGIWKDGGSQEVWMNIGQLGASNWIPGYDCEGQINFYIPWNSLNPVGEEYNTVEIHYSWQIYWYTLCARLSAYCQDGNGNTLRSNSTGTFYGTSGVDDTAWHGGNKLTVNIAGCKPSRLKLEIWSKGQGGHKAGIIVTDIILRK